MALAPLRFCFDYLSPYAYLAWTRMPALAARHGRVLEPVPVLLAGVLNATGNIGPAEVPAKRGYIFKHTFRIAHELGVPFGPPPSHPFVPLLALRVTAAVDDLEARARLVSTLFAQVWGGGNGAETPEQVATALQAAGLDAPSLLAAAQRQDIKDRVRRNTDEAIAAGAFGVPTVIADGELFFGLDSLGHLELFLRGEDPLKSEFLERWKNLPATASRR
ncbi:2-hydroxychromene-2-carboxylate isomerase [Myxococcus stipitatus DSM 14675]|uniref:2-hydroxychromene-2-carboxylate isomerase n=1 Tax=Myxococcus stipitatus (strain DSM 14675 / JCM 12634 / Mx s8) TaxID=1278073 RepID=L7UJS6_MYXSD|nr:2-hydroxychromene-2-carboxylate isomerase [Myxococcus stipitatus]AGC47772.1 2-hydroxychromene-2-carboxylate isomerase [Myxococcus stipitatus DSM 14675]